MIQHQSRLVNSLDILLYDLKLDGQNYPQLCSRVAYHLPSIKNPGNVSLIAWSLVASPALTVESLDNQIVAIHAIANAVASKVRIDLPTISVDDFINRLQQGAAQTLSSWKQDLVLAGICIGLYIGKDEQHQNHDKLRSKAQRHLINSLNNSFSYPQHVTLIVATTFPILDKTIFDSLDPNHLLIILQTCLFENISVPVIFQRANVICQACGRCISRADAATLDIVLKNIDAFSLQDTRAYSQDKLKVIFFALILLLESYTKRINSSFSWSIRVNGTRWCGNIMKVLLNLTFISHDIGTGGFNAYEFVYKVCIDVLMSHKDIADSVGYEIFSSKSKLESLFWLNYCEEWVTISDASTFESFILPNTKQYLSIPNNDDDDVDKMLIESAHSVILAALPAPQLAHVTRQFVSTHYIKCLFENHNLLSPHQFRLAFRVIVQSLTGGIQGVDNQINLAMNLIEQLYTIILQESNYDLKIIYILTLIDSLPTIPLNVFKQWLTTCSGLSTIYSNNDDDQVESRLWQVISGELDSQRADIAVRWWITDGRQRL